MARISEDDINSGVRKSKLSATFFKSQGEGGDEGWLNDVAANLVEKVKTAGRDVQKYLRSVAGGARVVFEKVTQGDWGFFREWFNEAPLLPKLAGTGAALLTGAVVLFVGGSAVAGVGAGMKGMLAASGFTNMVLLADAMPRVMGTVINAGEWAYNFDWAVPDSALVAQCKDAITGIYEPLGEALGAAVAGMLAGSIGSAFAQRVDLDMTLLAYFCIVNPTLEEEIVDAMSGLLQSVKDIAYEVLFLQTYKGVRQIAGKLTGNEEWGEDGQEPFIISQKVNEAYEKVKASDYLGHLTDEHWEGIEAFGESFYETFKDLLQEEDTYVNWQRR